MKKTLLILSTVGFAGCSSISLPVNGQTDDGRVWGGYFTIQTFELSSGDLICTGETPMGTARVQTATFTCSDGRTGVATTNRTRNTGGTVSVRFSDGTTGQMAYGT